MTRAHLISPRYLPAVALLLTATLALAGCGSEQNDDSLLLPTMENLENMQYQSTFTDAGTATLVRGSYRQGLPTPPGGDLIITLTRYRVIGRITPTQGGAAVVLRSAYGAGGVYFDLAAIVTTPTGSTNVALLGLGDRIKIRSLALKDRHIVLQMTVHAPNDPPCCPTVNVENAYAVRNNRLELLSSTRLEQ